MRKKNEIKIAWEIWNLISRLNDLIWDFYEEEFIEIYLKEEERKYWEVQKEKDALSDADF